MEKSHPYQWVSASSRPTACWIFIAAAVALALVMQVLGAPLKTAQAPAGIVSYELAGNGAASERILASWDTRVKAYAGLNLGLDYLFMVSYAAAIGMGCSLLALRIRTRSEAAGWIGIALAWGVLLAAVLDAVENAALLTLLLGSGTGHAASAWPAVARACAIPKFLLVALGLVYLAAAGIAVLAAPGNAEKSAARAGARKKTARRR